MAILHKNITSSGDIHNPKWHPDANNGDYAWKNEKGELESIDELLLPAALNFVDGSVAPPTSNTNDIYILSSGASVNAGWGSVALQDWVKYDGAAWNAITPQKSSLCYDKTADSLMSFNGTAWAAIGSGGGGGGNTIYTANDTIGTGRVATLTDSLKFDGGTVRIDGVNTLSTSTAFEIYDGDGTPNQLWNFNNDGSAIGNGLLKIDNTGGVSGVEHTGLVLESQGTVGSQLALDFKQNTFRIASVKSSVNGTSDNSLILGTNQQLELLHLRKTNIGINESDPDAKLHVNGDSLFNDILTIDNANGVQNADLTQLRLRTGGFFGGGTAIEFMHAFNNTYVNAKIRSVTNGSSDGSLILGTNQQIELIHLRKTNVGINESNPQAKLHVNGTVNFSNLPTSATGLTSGDIYNDSGTLKIV